ncbi:SLC41A family transporter [Sporobolomyces koalae]|uniref:SLC41A family transporter n=1 Tax=Sporobolomyces koalae TaxID=500713 RepID=UPI003173CC30
MRDEYQHAPLAQDEYVRDQHELEPIKSTRNPPRTLRSDTVHDDIDQLVHSHTPHRDDDDDEDEVEGLLDANDEPAGETSVPEDEAPVHNSTLAHAHTTPPNKRKRTIEQTLPVFFLVLVGAILTGELLEKLQAWRVFIRIEELFILVPILLNLKGNLDMNLAARFSTSANIGELDLRRTRRSLILGNLALLQVQALIVSFISGLIAFLLGLASRKGVHHALQHPVHKVGMIGTDDQGNDIRGGYFEALLVLCVSMLAAGISSGVLGSFMCSLVVLCRRFKVNPDNVATPIASILGDVVTLVILGGLASLFAKFMGTIISTLVFLLLIVAIAVNLVLTFRNAYVQELLSVGWGPLFLAMAISSGTGLVLETYINQFPGFSLLAPIFTAISASPASIFVARISTSLHSSRQKPRTQGRGETLWVTGGILWVLGMTVLGLVWVFGWMMNQVPRGIGFALSYLIAAGIQTLVGLVIAQQGCLILWKFNYDPDVYALPLLSSILDVTGQLLLVAAFAISKKTSTSSIIDNTTDTGLELVGDSVNGGEVVIRKLLSLL